MLPESYSVDSAGSSPAVNSANPRGPYLQAAPLSEVMLEQLQYLLAHGSQACAPKCPECARLTRIQKLLLLPFRTA